MPYPSRGTLGQFGMVFGFPCPNGFAQDFPLVANLKFAPGQFGQERASASFSHQLIDVRYNIYRKHFVSLFGSDASTHL